MKKIIRNKEDLTYFVDLVQKMFKDGNAYIAEFKKKPKKRNLSQNNLYWLWIACICSEQGYLKTDKKYVSERLKEILGIPFVKKEVLGEIITEYKSTADMSEAEMSKYMKELQEYIAIEYSIVLPNKEDRYFEEFYQAYKE